MARPKREEKKLTTKEFMEAMNERGRKISRQRLHQLRQGTTQVKNGVEYEIAPQLRKGSDWWWEDGVVYYAESAVEKLMS